MDAPEEMRRFWDARAREDAYFFIDNRLRYRHPDVERFWSDGECDLDAILVALDVSIGSDDVVIDVGCGIGRLTRPLAARAAVVWGLDVSAQMLDRARAVEPPLANVRWVQGDGTTLDGIPDGVADGCVSHVVFQHIPDPAITLGYVREMGRVLRPRGWAAFHVSNDPGLHRPARLGPADRLRAALGRAPRAQDQPAWLGAAVELDEIVVAAAAGGMEIERVTGTGTQFCHVLARKRAP